MGWVGYHAASTGITTSEALADEPPPAGSDQNILIMGLDGRRDQRGRPLPPDIYDALHAGGEDSGEGDADALIVLHLPAGNAPATAISIPRDDYVDLAGCPTSSCRGKIKEAYRFAYQKVIDDGSDGAESPAAKEQKAREAGRKAEISTVRKLLEIPIDHFIEVTLVGFFQVARVVQPITVCLNEDTSDRYYSGADFHRGTQQINADQAMAFVRQRRDTDNELFTDLDRTRRQQAFIVSLVNALRRNGTLSNPARLRSLLDVAKQNVAVDAGLDFEGFLRDASAFPDRPVTLYTLPVTDFGAISNGEDVNFIDVSTIRSIVRKLVAPSSPTAAPQTANAAQPNAGTIALDVVNASGVEGEAAHLEKSLATKPFIAGMVSTADSISQSSTIIYGPGAKAAAGKLAGELGLSASASDNVAPNTVRLTVGTDIANLEYPNHTTESPTTTVTTVSATATGTQQPSPTDLTRMAADNIPCVR
ncbi:transcriptional regulator [Mycobacterium sp. MFM001]|nr:transcriptional regulator [Mycobacterium sp. MFM001]